MIHLLIKTIFIAYYVANIILSHFQACNALMFALQL